MSLNTNGWDFGYHIKLDEANKILKANAGADLNLVKNFVDTKNISFSANPVSDFLTLNSLILNQLIQDAISTLIKTIPLCAVVGLLLTNNTCVSNSPSWKRFVSQLLVQVLWNCASQWEKHPQRQQQATRQVGSVL